MFYSCIDLEFYKQLLNLEFYIFILLIYFKYHLLFSFSKGKIKHLFYMFKKLFSKILLKIN